MLGVGWPVELIENATRGDQDVLGAIIGFAVLVLFSALVLWSGQRAVRKVSPELRIERPAEIRKAA